MASRPTAIHKLGADSAKGKWNWGIYGDPGAGKTVLAATAPQNLFLTIDDAGTESAVVAPSTAPGTSEWVIKEWADLDKAHDWLAAGGAAEFEWVTLDTVSEAEAVCMATVVEEQYRRNKSRSREVPGMDSYQMTYIRMRNLVKKFNLLPVNMLYTFHGMRIDTPSETDEDELTTLLLPMVGSLKNGVVSQQICAKLGVVAYLNVVEPGKETRRLWTQKTARMFAKDRTGAFGRYVDAPNIEEMAEAALALRSGSARKPKKRRKAADG